MFQRIVHRILNPVWLALLALPLLAVPLPSSRALRRPSVCLFLLLILTCGFLVFPARAQNCSESIIFADDFESDPSSRWTIEPRVNQSLPPSPLATGRGFIHCPTVAPAQPSSPPTL